MKITDPSFHLRHISATEVKRVLDSGATSPLLVIGTDEATFQEDDFVVKLKSSQFQISNAICELVGSFIAMELDIKVPEPVLINISQLLVETCRGKSYYELIRNGIGINCGCKFLSGYQSWLPYSFISKGLLQPASDIFMFDVLTLNADRRNEKPNLLTNGSEIIAIDHEKSLQPPLFGDSTPWLISGDAQNISNSHIFKSALSGKALEIDGFLDKTTRLNSGFWDIAANLIPPIWLDNTKKGRVI